MGKSEWQEPLGCLLWIVVFFMLITMLSIGDELINFLEAWLKEHS